MPLFFIRTFVVVNPFRHVPALLLVFRITYIENQNPMRERNRNSALFRFAIRAIVPVIVTLAAPMLWSQSTVSENGEPPDTGTNAKAACSNSKKIKLKMRGGPVVITAASGAV